MKKKGGKFKGTAKEKPVEVPDLDELTRNSDDEMELLEREADSDFEGQIEVGKLVDSDDDDVDERDPKRWEKIEKKELAEIERRAKSWGKNKDVYYDTDTQYFEVDDDETNAKLEEEEALRLQKQQAASLNDQDFGLEELISSKKAKKGKNAEILKAVSTAASTTYDLTKNDKIKQVIDDSPELLSLLDEYTAKMKELRTEVQPLLERAKSQDPSMQTSDGISFLQLRFQLLLSYCIHIAFYLLLKAEGKNVQDHPVIKRLVHIRVIIEKIRPVMNQLKYQIEKLLKTSAMAGSSVVKVASDKEADLMAFKPNLDSFGKASKVGSTDTEDYKEEKKSKSRNRLIGSTAYEQEERLASKVQEEREIARERASQSRLVQELRQELSDKPEEQSSIGTSMHRLSALDKERMAFEEEHYMRLMDTKDVKKRRRMAERLEGYDDVDDFADLSALVNLEKKQKKSADDNAKALALLRSRTSAARSHESLDNAQDDVEDDVTAEDAQYYSEFTSNAETQRAAKKSRKQDTGIYMKDEETIEDGDRRGAGVKILKNKGLMRAPKKHSHARVALRAKHEKALVKRRSQVKEFTGKVDVGYGGEATGIKKTLIRSRKIKT